jgi:hypothetical protein
MKRSGPSLELVKLLFIPRYYPTSHPTLSSCSTQIEFQSRASGMVLPRRAYYLCKASLFGRVLECSQYVVWAGLPDAQAEEVNNCMTLFYCC